MAYTNSGLVKHTYLSPNHYKGRNCINGVTVHCVVGHGTWQGVGEWFSRVSTQASCNYFVDDNGDVTLIVPEENGSWCTSNYNNDMNKVTIEVASDKTTPYAFTEKAYLGVVKLVADIYKRNGIKKATFTGNTNGNITCHRWFKNKECPGNHFYEKLTNGDFCKRVNALLNGGSEMDTPKQVPGKTANDENLQYRAHVQSLGWLDPVRDGQCAGTCGYEKRLEAINITMPGDESCIIKCKAHVQRKGWITYEGHDITIGTTGEGLRLEALEMHAEGLPEGKKLMYQVHVQSLGWMDWADDGFPTGTMNQSKRIEAIRMKIVEA